MSAAPNFVSTPQPPLFLSLLESLCVTQSAAGGAANAVERRKVTLNQYQSELQLVEEDARAAMKAFCAITQLPAFIGEPRTEIEGKDGAELARGDRALISRNRCSLQLLAASIPCYVELASRLEVATDHTEYSAWRQAAAEELPGIAESLATGDVAALTVARNKLQAWLSNRASVVSAVERQYSIAKHALENQILCVGRAESATASRLSAVNEARGQAYSSSIGAAVTGAVLACLPGSCYGAVATGQTAMESGVTAAVAVGVTVFVIALLVKLNGGDTAKAEQDFRTAESQLAEARGVLREAQQKLDKLEQQRSAILG